MISLFADTVPFLEEEEYFDDEYDDVPDDLSHMPWDNVVVNNHDSFCHGDIDLAMSEARRNGLPILAVFSDWSKEREAWRCAIFSDPDVAAVASHCFVLALFNTADRYDPELNEAMRWWGDGLHDSDAGYIRIVTPEGKIVAATGALAEGEEVDEEDDDGNGGGNTQRRRRQPLDEMKRIMMEAWCKIDMPQDGWSLRLNEEETTTDDWSFSDFLSELGAGSSWLCSDYYSRIVLRFAARKKRYCVTFPKD